jgi:hypothetical protein
VTGSCRRPRLPTDTLVGISKCVSLISGTSSTLSSSSMYFWPAALATRCCSMPASTYSRIAYVAAHRQQISVRMSAPDHLSIDTAKKVEGGDQEDGCVGACLHVCVEERCQGAYMCVPCARMYVRFCLLCAKRGLRSRRSRARGRSASSRRAVRRSSSPAPRAPFRGATLADARRSRPGACGDAGRLSGGGGGPGGAVGVGGAWARVSTCRAAGVSRRRSFGGRRGGRNGRAGGKAQLN